MKGLVLGDRLTLPLDWMTLSTVVYGARGAGKTTSGAVMAEEVFAAGQRFCAIDLKGDWWGLKAAADGEGLGIPVVVFGGDHADLPLEPDAGAYIAETIARLEQPAILDLEHLSKGKQLRFLAAFFERLYDRNREPLLLLLDEAQRYAPQKPMNPDANVCLGAVEDLVKLGRKHGIGIVLFTQRGSGLNKEVSELCDMLVAFRTPGSLDQDRIKDWLGANAGRETAAGIMRELSGLPTGTAVFASNHPALRIGPTYVTLRPRRTFDSSATPKIGQRRREPKLLAKPDIERLRQEMADAIERAKADDPKELRKEIAQLRAEIARRPAEVERIVEKVVEVPLIDDKDVDALAAIGSLISDASERSAMAMQQLADLSQRLAERKTGQKREPAKVVPIRPPTTEDRLQRDLERSLAREQRKSESNGSLGKAERTILAVLAVHGEMSQSRLALQTGYSPKASTIGVALSRLRREGLVESGQPLRATPEGIAQADTSDMPPERGRALLEYWLGKIGKAEREILRTMVAAFPRELSYAEIAEATGYSPTASTVGVALSRLRKLELISGFEVNEDLIG